MKSCKRNRYLQIAWRRRQWRYQHRRSFAALPWRCYVTALATGLAQQLKSVRWAAVLPSIIDAAEREPELAQLLAQLHAGRMVPYFAVAARAKKSTLRLAAVAFPATLLRYRVLRINGKPDQATLPGGFQNEIILSHEFFNEIMSHPIPTDMETAKALSSSPAALDLFMWLAHRCFVANPGLVSQA